MRSLRSDIFQDCDIVYVSLATHSLRTGDLDVHFTAKEQELRLSCSLLQDQSCRNNILLTDFNNLKPNYVTVCFNFPLN